MRARELIEKAVNDELEANTDRDEAGNPKVVRVPVISLVLTTLEIFLDMRDILLSLAMATGSVRLTTEKGVELPGQGQQRRPSGLIH